MGNVIQPIEAVNVARVMALKAGLPNTVPAYTVNRACASSLDALTSAADKIRVGEADTILVGGAESMSNAPLLFPPQMSRWLTQYAKAKTFSAQLKALLSWRPSLHKPIIGLEMGLTDPICGLIMGATAEVLAREFGISRMDQDAYALESHQKAAQAISKGFFSNEVIAVPTPPDYVSMISQDDGPRPHQTLEALSKLPPYYDRAGGTVTVGNSCAITDGAVALLVMRESQARDRGLKPIGYLQHYAYAALDGAHMGLGPVHATAKLLDKTGLEMSDFDLIELNEAFAAQVLACEKAFSSTEFSKQALGRTKPVGVLALDKLNVNGGAIALGHPVGATGTRLVLTLCLEMQRRKVQRGLVTLCVGGGQGAALAIEAAP